MYTYMSTPTHERFMYHNNTSTHAVEALHTNNALDHPTDPLFSLLPFSFFLFRLSRQIRLGHYQVVSLLLYLYF